MNRCKVCARIGKDANHYTKVHGVVVCPVIKNAICKRCGKNGHFQDHCKESPKITITTTKPTSRYPCEEEDDDDNTDNEDTQHMPIPTIWPVPKVKPQESQIKLAPWANPNTVITNKKSWAYDSDEE